MAEEEVGQAIFEKQVEGFLSAEIGDDEKKVLDLLKERGLFQAADEKLDLPQPITDPPDKIRIISDSPWHQEWTYKTDQGDTFLRAEIKEEGKGHFVTKRELVRLGPKALESFKKEIAE